MNIKTMKMVITVLVGNALLAFVVAAFVVPIGLVMGGATGLGLTISHYLPEIDLSIIIFFVNIILFLLGALNLGRAFAIKTIMSTVFYPIMLEIVERIPGIQNLTDNVLLSVIYAGLLLGLGIGVIIRAGSSTGGSDILALVINKKFHVPIAVCVYTVDVIIIGLQVMFSTAEQVLYGVLALVICTVVIGKVTVVGQSQIQLFVISEHYKEIKSKLLSDLEVGATLVKIETGLHGKEQSAVLCITQNRKLYEVNQTIQAIDPKAFITISQINEVKGRGFSLDREYGKH